VRHLVAGASQVGHLVPDALLREEPERKTAGQTQDAPVFAGIQKVGRLVCVCARHYSPYSPYSPMYPRAREVGLW
jgi:hypothetical protein